MNKTFRILLTFLFVISVAVSCAKLESENNYAAPTLDDGSYKLTILQTTDVHHHAQGIGPASTYTADPADGDSVQGGYERLGAYIEYTRAKATAEGNHDVLLVDSGDFFMGTVYDLTLAAQPAALNFMALMKYDAITFGNHEFDYGPGPLADAIKKARAKSGFTTPIIATNMKISAGEGDSGLRSLKNDGLIKETFIKTLPSGVKVGFIGLMGPNADSYAPMAPPTTFTHNYTALQATVNELKKNCNIVIALSHGGIKDATKGDDVTLAKSVTGIDIIFSGHEHITNFATITNGTHKTRIICAGFAGQKIAKYEISFTASSGVATFDYDGADDDLSTSAEAIAMTDATIGAMIAEGGANALSTQTGLARNGFVNAMLIDGLNKALAPVFAQLLSNSVSTINQQIGTATVDAGTSLSYSEIYGLPSGIGNLAADSVRTVANGNLGGTNGTDPFILGVVATGVIRDSLGDGPISFTDLYNVLPLGASPDTTQAIPVGYPVMSAYVTGEDVKKLCAMQMLVAFQLASPSFYLNFSGIKYTLKDAENKIFYKYATVAAALDYTSKAYATETAAGTPGLASQVMADLLTTGGGSLKTLADENKYAKAIVQGADGITDGATDFDAPDMTVILNVATAASKGKAAITALIISKAVPAIDVVSYYNPTDPTDPTCTGPAATVLADGNRYRVAADLYAILMMEAAKKEFGLTITAYSASTGSTFLSATDMSTTLKNRIDATPNDSSSLVELKEWACLVGFVNGPLGGAIPKAVYGATQNASTQGAMADYITDAVYNTWGTGVKTRDSIDRGYLGGYITVLSPLM